MELIYLEEHSNCINYIKEDRPPIEKKNINMGQNWVLNAVCDNKLIFVIRGTASVSYDNILNMDVNKGNIILLPLGSEMKVFAQKETSVFIVRLLNNTIFCDRFSYRQLVTEIENKQTNIDVVEKKDDTYCSNNDYLLNMNDSIWYFINNLDERIEDGLRCSTLFSLKLKELFILFRAYYTKEDLHRFFKPLLYTDQDFFNIVMTNYRNVKTVNELAEFTNYSFSGFEKKFKRIFNISAGKWLKSKKSEIIYQELVAGSKTFKHLCSEYGFSSPSHLNTYCKRNFGLTPGEIRKKKDCE